MTSTILSYPFPFTCNIHLCLTVHVPYMINLLYNHLSLPSKPFPHPHLQLSGVHWASTASGFPSPPWKRSSWRWVRWPKGTWPPGPGVSPAWSDRPLPTETDRLMANRSSTPMGHRGSRNPTSRSACLACPMERVVSLIRNGSILSHFIDWPIDFGLTQII